MKSLTVLTTTAVVATALFTSVAAVFPTGLRALGGGHDHAHDHSGHVHLDENLVNVRSAVGTYNNVVSQCICAGKFDTTVDYFPEKMVAPTDAVGFNITYHKYYKVLTNRKTSKVYVLVQCGAPEPLASEIASSNYVTIKVPLSNVATRSTTYLPMIETLGERETLKKIQGTFYCLHWNREC